MNAQLLLAKRLPHLLGVCLPLVGSPWAHAGFIQFPALTPKEHRGVNPDPDLPHPNESVQLNLFYSADSGPLRFLAEAIATPERPQASWPHPESPGGSSTSYGRLAIQQGTARALRLTTTLPVLLMPPFTTPALYAGAQHIVLPSGKQAAIASSTMQELRWLFLGVVAFLSKLPLYETTIASSAINDLDKHLQPCHGAWHHGICTPHGPCRGCKGRGESPSNGKYEAARL